MFDERTPLCPGILGTGISSEKSKNPDRGVLRRLRARRCGLFDLCRSEAPGRLAKLGRGLI